MIVARAIEFFAEVGFTGQTRELAQRIGVTQPLLYRYFPTKDLLIERVFQETFVGRWKPEWEDLLADRSRPLRERLSTIYLAYLETVLTHQSVRIFMHSGLKDGAFNRRYLTFVREHLLEGICREVRAAHGLPPAHTVPLAEDELEAAWGLHGSFFYVGIRRSIYGLETPADLRRVVDSRIGAFLDGAGAEAERILAASGARGGRRAAGG